MPLQLVLNNIDSEVGANEPWPDDVKLFQPFETEQILLPDNASSLAVQAFLRMCNLQYEVVQRRNAEEMSPSGRVPFIKCGAFLISELEPLMSFLENKV
ncbi:metaxin-2-like [Macrosteles quadrilineatus]|uniref:metaxin-2-like n=1 Tax=Macrosteles quadrilineatus TaxID=74068 RepID=UPI0023E0AD16|nr:metaxin-2-like [Macrosteles quadrilineatus]